MEKFAFITNPVRVSDISGKLGLPGFLPEKVLEGLLRLSPPLQISTIQGVTPNCVRGWLLAVPLTSRQMMQLSESLVIRRIIQAAQKAQVLGASIVGVGSFMSWYKNAGHILEKNVTASVTTGNSYTMAMALAVIKKVAVRMKHARREIQVVVTGADTEIGKIYALLLAREVENMILVGSQKNKLGELANKIFFDTGLSSKVTMDIDKAWRKGGVIVSLDPVLPVGLQDLQPGTIVYQLNPLMAGCCHPHGRKDILVIEEAVVDIPQDFIFSPCPGLPPGTVCPAMAETMMLSLEQGMIQDFMPSKGMHTGQVESIEALAVKKGFAVAGIKSNGIFMPMEDVEQRITEIFKNNMNLE